MTARPVINNKYRREAVNLQPYGNTVSITTDSDNPFEDARPVDVYTQLSGGMAPPDAAQRSRKIHTKPTVRSVVKGGVVPTIVVNEASHRGFIPGMGEDPSTASTIADALTQATTAAGNVLTADYAAQAAKAAADKAASDAKAAQTQLTMSQLLNKGATAVGEHKAISIPLLVVGVGAAVTALVLYMNSGKKKKR
jgi:hypothetical protein